MQGLGGVGAVLVDLLREAGVEVLVSDVDPNRVAHALQGGTTHIVHPDEVIETACDIFSPCAVGGILNERSISRLRARVVAGSANNQLETPEDTDRLRRAKVVYAPDFVINAGGVLHLVGAEMLDWAPKEIEERLRGIGDTLREIYRTADAEGITTAVAAERLTASRLAAAVF